MNEKDRFILCEKSNIKEDIIILQAFELNNIIIFNKIVVSFGNTKHDTTNVTICNNIKQLYNICKQGKISIESINIKNNLGCQLINMLNHGNNKE